MSANAVDKLCLPTPYYWITMDEIPITTVTFVRGRTLEYSLIINYKMFWFSRYITIFATHLRIHYSRYIFFWNLRAEPQP